MTNLFETNFFLPNSSGLGYGTKVHFPRTTYSEFVARRHRRRLLKTGAILIALTVCIYITRADGVI